MKREVRKTGEAAQFGAEGEIILNRIIGIRCENRVARNQAPGPFNPSESEDGTVKAI